LETVHSSYREEVKEIGEFMLKLAESLLAAGGALIEKQWPPLAAEEKEALESLNGEEVVARAKELGLESKLQEFRDGMGGLGGLADLLRSVIDLAESVNVPSRLIERLREFTKTLAQMHYLSEMAIVYVVTLEEAFVCDYVRAILHVQPAMLRTEKELTLTFDKACDIDSYQAFRNCLENAAIEPLSRGGIEEASSYFEKRLNVRLDEFPNWDEMKEVSYRRNIIVHNKGEVNKTYREKTGYNGPHGYLGINKPYISNAVDVTIKFIDFVHERVSAVLRLHAQ
jgi:hypothetical protein